MQKGTCTPGCMYLSCGNVQWELHSTPVHQSISWAPWLVTSGWVNLLPSCCAPERAVPRTPSRARLQTAPALHLKDRCGLGPPCCRLQGSRSLSGSMQPLPPERAQCWTAPAAGNRVVKPGRGQRSARPTDACSVGHLLRDVRFLLHPCQ